MDGWRRQVMPRAKVSTHPLGTPIHEALPRAQGTFQGYSPVPQGTLQADPVEGLGAITLPEETVSLRLKELKEVNVAIGLAAGTLGFLLGRMGGPVPLVAFAAVAAFTLGAEVNRESKG